MRARWSTVVIASCVALAGCASEGDEPTGGVDDVQQEVTATTQTEAVSSAVTSDLEDLGTAMHILGVEPATLTFFDLTVSSKARWQGTLNSDVTWDSDKVRQGQDLAVTRAATTSTGVIKMVWSISGTLRPLDLFDVPVGPIPLAVDVNSCKPINVDCPSDGSASDLAACVAGAATYHCSGDSPGLTLFETPGIPLSPYVDLSIDVDFTIGPNGAITTRNFFVGDETIVPETDLNVTKQDGSESIAMPCNKPAGQSVQYVVDPFKWSPSSIDAKQQPQFSIGLMDPFFGVVRLPALFNASFGPAHHSAPAFKLEGAGTSIDMGELQPNNVLPTIAPLGGFSGQEGAPVSFSASVTSACPITAYVWKFSDGTTSFGPTPQRAFGDDGLFDGQLKVTDMTNLSATGDFTCAISNRAPVPDAGPDTSGAWGRPIGFNGQATDPGWDDQSTLTYQWDFGDGTPGTGGASVSHAYANPGNYVAVLRVCDDHGCINDSANVYVRRRTTAVAYTGSNTGISSATAALTGSIMDEFSEPVVGGTIDFTLAGSPVGSAQTNALGNATRTIDITPAAGSYLVSAAYAGSFYYFGNATSESFDVTRMATTMQYTGALTGAPNKTITLSAKLADALGRPLDGKVVVFKLGTQQVQATTGASGVSGLASTTLKLTQKNGKYLLTATWAPAGADTTRWTGSSASATFSLQSR